GRHPQPLVRHSHLRVSTHGLIPHSTQLPPGDRRNPRRPGRVLNPCRSGTRRPRREEHMSTLVLVLVGALVVLRVLGKQLTGSFVTAKSLVLMPAILIVIGLGGAAAAVSLARPSELLFFLVDAVIVVGLGLARGA